ncbi:hypothetical protein Y032_0927g3075 [Ancylostoma ceylanicum]|uniref:Uncharacterized protein n=1 Tax=Ancylostoma ceylanicum TaxID=53326 RepID=A0A016W8J9_9BILA|nr:hypothetical protein Y032_0927g3075 [Ancylostoma ceylanicum]
MKLRSNSVRTKQLPLKRRQHSHYSIVSTESFAKIESFRVESLDHERRSTIVKTQLYKRSSFRTAKEIDLCRSDATLFLDVLYCKITKMRFMLKP